MVHRLNYKSIQLNCLYIQNYLQIIFPLFCYIVPLTKTEIARKRVVPGNKRQGHHRRLQVVTAHVKWVKRYIVLQFVIVYKHY